jgi:hypothetical protein
MARRPAHVDDMGESAPKKSRYQNWLTGQIT